MAVFACSFVMAMLLFWQPCAAMQRQFDQNRGNYHLQYQRVNDATWSKTKVVINPHARQALYQ